MVLLPFLGFRVTLMTLYANRVYGLQRAFKIAGAKYLIMSLWQVKDEATMKFMEVFYRKWLEDKVPIPEAFRAAQADMRERSLGSPYLWAGFVLVE